MSTISGKHFGVSLTNVANNPVTLTRTAYIGGSKLGIGVDAQSTYGYPNYHFAWTIVNLGYIGLRDANGLRPGIGIDLEAGGKVTNQGHIFAYTGIESRVKPASVTNLYGGFIEGLGVKSAIYLNAGGTVTNAGSIFNGVVIRGNTATITNTGKMYSLDNPVAISLAGTVNDVLVNSGQITFAQGWPVRFGANATVTNTGLLQPGIYFKHGGVVTNKGLISGDEPAVDIGEFSTVNNYGIIEGVSLLAGGMVNNAKTTAIIQTDERDAVRVGNFAATITNLGAIETGSAAAGIAGIDVEHGGRVTNGNAADKTALISGFSYGVENNSSGSLVLTNYATIHGGAGTKYEGIGVLATSPNNNTVTNSGTITGDTGTAVAFGAGNDRLIDNLGAVFGGIVDGGAGSNEIDLSQTGTFEPFPNFRHFSVIHLSDSGPTLLLLGDVDFAGLPKDRISVFDGSKGDTVSGPFLASTNPITVTCGPGPDLLRGGAGTDTASYAKAKGGVVADLDDNEFATGDAKGDTYSSIENLTGSLFADTLYGDHGGNRLTGGGGNDILVGEAGADTLDGGGGADTVAYDASAAGVHADLLLPATNTGDAAGDAYISIENLDGSSFGDFLFGDNNANVIGGNLYHATASGNDRLFGRGGNDQLFGYDGNDSLDGGAGADIMTGGTGNDVYYVDNPGDKVVEAANGGTDLVRSTISYTLTANIENLILNGTANINGAGNTAANAVIGNAGRNLLDGGAGKDTLTGGPGRDVFVFDTPLNASTNVDLITDFTHGTDTIRLAHTDFTTLAPGPLPAGAFYANPTGAAAHATGNRIIYDAANGALFYDANGSKPGGATQFATLTPHLAPSAGDFFIV